MCGLRKFYQSGSNSDNVFYIMFILIDEGREDPNTTISGPSSVTSETPFNFFPFKCRFAGKPMVAQH